MGILSMFEHDSFANFETNARIRGLVPLLMPFNHLLPTGRSRNYRPQLAGKNSILPSVVILRVYQSEVTSGYSPSKRPHKPSN